MTNLLDMDRAALKGLVKEALSEALLEQRDLLREVVEEVMEDIALTRAIEEGRETSTVDRSEVLRVLQHDR